ncbi:centromere DNA-binding protein complex CBF3 subunit [Hirsutella rhossiliensis]|uniref:Centromere DNA-binding protein complex CBF3 subunit n=1 Tax=Hirsutella rhossiliensis TaxID=111463 RepID=A0A9P8SHW7_9HYPO|nr:centromere DNA-binding protein complex CBF3 subunit [Hirsutella rhossiliensis]KAH0962584.1 centromere DNA-binding protein complex CBF3 subunit [Hirsutella rhossiliensis]
MAADDSYTAADERARAARRAGIQAKKDEQPANTARSYAAKQREWKAWCHTPRAAEDGELYSWPDGELVTPDKLAAWLKEDILLRRVVPPQKKRARRPKVWPKLGGPLAEAAELLADDREGYVPPTGLATAAVDLTEGYLLTRGTIDAYIAAVVELWRLRVAHGNANTENPRGAADWYRIKVLVGRDREQELSYPTQLQETWRIFGAAGLIASKKTHLPRRVGAQDAETHGTSLAQISQAGRWNQSVLCQAYLTHLPRQFMRIVAGFSASPGGTTSSRVRLTNPRTSYNGLFLTWL